MSKYNCVKCNIHKDHASDKKFLDHLLEKEIKAKNNAKNEDYIKVKNTFITTLQKMTACKHKYI